MLLNLLQALNRRKIAANTPVYFIHVGLVRHAVYHTLLKYYSHPSPPGTPKKLDGRLEPLQTLIRSMRKRRILTSRILFERSVYMLFTIALG